MPRAMSRVIVRLTSTLAARMRREQVIPRSNSDDGSRVRSSWQTGHESRTVDPSLPLGMTRSWRFPGQAPDSCGLRST